MIAVASLENCGTVRDNHGCSCPTGFSPLMGMLGLGMLKSYIQRYHASTTCIREPERVHVRMGCPLVSTFWLSIAETSSSSSIN